MALMVTTDLVEPVTARAAGRDRRRRRPDRRATGGAARRRHPPVGAPRPRPRRARSARTGGRGRRGHRSARAPAAPRADGDLGVLPAPESAAQVDRVEQYAAALGFDGPELEIARHWIDEGVERATADFDRFYGESLPALSEPSLRDDYLRIEEPDLELAQRLEALHDLPEGTLGHAYIEFYRRNNITVPGADMHTPAHYVSHDMNHVISGYEPTGPGEIALGAFTLAMNDNDANWIQFIANLAIHEAGLVQHGAIMPKDSTLTRPGATDLLGEALWRGAAVHRRLQPGRSPRDGRLAARRRARALRRARRAGTARVAPPPPRISCTSAIPAW